MLDGLELVAPIMIPILGLVVGSFLNVVIYRIPNDLSVSHPPSACPNCAAAIKPYDNIPVLSWLMLRAKCRNCGTPISARYPSVELFTSVAFYFTYVVIGFTGVLPAYLWFVATTIALAMIDFDTKRLPDRIVFPGTIVGAILLSVGAWVDADLGGLGRAWLAGLAFFVGFTIVALIYPKGFGFGDVKMSFMLGLFTGFVSWRSLVVSIYVAIIFGGVVSLVLLLIGRAGRKSTIPFGPWLIVGAWTGVAFGPELADLYSRYFLAM